MALTSALARRPLKARVIVVRVWDAALSASFRAAGEPVPALQVEKAMPFHTQFQHTLKINSLARISLSIGGKTGCGITARCTVKAYFIISCGGIGKTGGGVARVGIGMYPPGLVGGTGAHVVLAVDHLAAPRIDHHVVRSMVVTRVALLGAGIARRADHLGRVEIGVWRLTHRHRVPRRIFLHARTRFDGEAVVHLVSQPPCESQLPTRTLLDQAR